MTVPTHMEWKVEVHDSVPILIGIERPEDRSLAAGKWIREGADHRRIRYVSAELPSDPALSSEAIYPERHP